MLLSSRKSDIEKARQFVESKGMGLQKRPTNRGFQ
jgi:hypothetical protein